MIRRYAYALVLAAVVVVSMLCLCGGYAWYEDHCQQAGGHLHVGYRGAPLCITGDGRVIEP